MEPRLGRPPPNVKSDRHIAGLYDMESTLGSGHFAVVKLARHVFTGEKVAVKVIDKTKLDEKAKEHLYQEVRCMKLVQHPNVVRLYEVIDTQTKLYLILEFGDGGDMYDYIMKHEGLGIAEEKAKLYFQQIVSAIDYCHKLHVVHRDLKPENVIFFKNQDVAKLTDFGFSNSFLPGEKLYTSCGSLAYSAPEILLGDSYDAPAVDVWSLGVILYMMVCGTGPFSHANDSETLTMIMDCKYEMPAHLSEQCKSLIRKMLVRDPKKRATLDAIATDGWLDGCTLKVPPSPLVSEMHVTPSMHLAVVQKMEVGCVATREEIKKSLESNNYNHVTATYFLLSERLMRKKYGSAPNLHTKLQARHSSPHRDKGITDENRNTHIVSNDTLAVKSPLASPVRTRRTASLYVERSSNDDETPTGSDGGDYFLRLSEDSKEKSHSEELLSDTPLSKVDFKRPPKQNKAHRMSYPIFQKTQSTPNLLNGISEECDSDGEESPRNSPRNSKRSLNRRRKFPPQRHGCRLSPIHSRRSSCSSSDDDEKLELRRGNFASHLAGSIASQHSSSSGNNSTRDTTSSDQSGQGRTNAPGSNKENELNGVGVSLSTFLMKNRDFPERILSDSNLMAYIANHSSKRYSMHRRQKKCPSDTDLTNLCHTYSWLSLSSDINEKLSVLVKSHRNQRAGRNIACRIEEENPGDVSPNTSPRRRPSKDDNPINDDRCPDQGDDSETFDSSSRESSSEFTDLKIDRRSSYDDVVAMNMKTYMLLNDALKAEWNNNNNTNPIMSSSGKNKERRSQSDVPSRMCYLRQMNNSVRHAATLVDGSCCVLV